MLLMATEYMDFRSSPYDVNVGSRVEAVRHWDITMTVSRGKNRERQLEVDIYNNTAAIPSLGKRAF